VATAWAGTAAWSPREPVGADDLLTSRRTGEIENESIDRNRDFEFDFILRYINSERETLAYLLRKIRRY
jgi:hypothetical protein